MNKEQPLISVIVPIYNTITYLEKCVYSIINQTYDNLEILLIDDGSQDGTADLCDAFAQMDSRIVVIHRKNAGQADARNYGLHIAKGEYVGFVDSDDVIELDMYDKLLSAIEDNNCDVAMCARYIMDEDSGIKRKIYALEAPAVWGNEEIIKRFLTWQCIDGSPCDKLFKKNILNDLRFPLGLISEDIPFVYEALKRTKQLIHIGIPKYIYLQRQNSTSRSVISSKTEGLVKYPYKIREDIKKTYPNLIQQADYFYFSRELVYIKRLCQENYIQEAKSRTEIIKNNCSKLFFNRNFTCIQKIRIVLIWLNIYVPVCKLFRK